MGDMREEYDAYKEEAKKRKQKHTIDVGTYLDELDDVSIQCHNKEQGHHILTFNSGKRLQVWVSTVKFNEMGTNEYSGGFKALKKKIDKLNKEE